MLTEKQREFCKLYISGNNATEAYCIAYNTTNVKTSTAAASRLLTTHKIKLFISELQAENKKIVDMANDKAAKVIADGSIADATERMQILTKIMRGELTVEEEVITMTGMQTLTVNPTFADRRAAIAELNKMAGDYAPAKSETTITDTRPPSKITTPDGLIIEL